MLRPRARAARPDDHPTPPAQPAAGSGVREEPLCALVSRFSDGVRNPMAALKGAAEFLLVEQQRREAPADERDFVALMLRELERLERAVEAHEAELLRRSDA